MVTFISIGKEARTLHNPNEALSAEILRRIVVGRYISAGGDSCIGPRFWYTSTSLYLVTYFPKQGG